MIQRLLWSAFLVGGIAGCKPVNKPATEAPPALVGSPITSTLVPPRVNGAVGASQTLLPPQIVYGTPAASAPPAAASGASGGDISLDFADTDVREVVAQILGTILRLNYTIDPAVHGSTTLRTTRPLTRAELLPTLQSMLAQNGAALVQSDGLYRVVPAAQAITAAGSAATAGYVVVPLRYAQADDLAKVLQPFVGDAGRITADPARNALVVGGEPQARDSLIALIQAFDVDALAGQSYALLPVGGGDAKDFSTALQDAFRSQSGGATAGLVRVVPMPRIDAVLVIAPAARYIEAARQVFSLVQRQQQQNVRIWHVVYLHNGHPNDIANVLQQAFTPNRVTAQPEPKVPLGYGVMGAGQGNGGPGGGGLGIGGAGGQGIAGVPQGGMGGLGGQAMGGSALSQVPQAAAQAPGLAGGSPLAGPLEQGGSEVDQTALRIIPDPQNNALLIQATSREESAIEAMLRKLDIMPLQVRIDAVIAEVTLNDNLQFGTQFFFQAGGINSALNFAQQQLQSPSQIALNTSFPGFFIGGHGTGGAPLALSALQAVTTVNVLSSPELMVLDNHPARLQVGDVVPYLTESSQSTLIGSAPVINSINYQPTGVILEITPRVNTGGLVTLDIRQEVSDVSTTITTPGINSPTFLERNIASRVAVQDGQTIGLAGLIRDSSTLGNQGIPWLKDVPVLGLLAGNQNNMRQRTELLMLLTPHVVHDGRDARELTEDLRDQLGNVAHVPGRLNRQPASGSDDPSAPLRRQMQLDQ
jgi:general secretion pathway protein D